MDPDSAIKYGLPAGASLLGGYLSSSGQQQAAQTQANAATAAAGIGSDAARRALDLQERLANEQVLRNAPYSEAGIAAQNRMLDLMGLSTRTGAAGFGSANQPYSMAGFDPNSLMRNFGQEDLNKDVLFESALGNLNRGSNNRLAAAGLFRSPQRALAEVRNRLAAGSGAFERFQTNRASQAGLFADAYNRDRTRQLDEFSRLGGLMTSGQNAAAGTGASQAAYGSNAANLISQGAQAMGQGVLGAGQAIGAGQLGGGRTAQSAIDAALQGYQNNQMMDLFRNPTIRQSAYAPQQAAPYDPYGRFGYGTNT